jgi:hypothetical protein
MQLTSLVTKPNNKNQELIFQIHKGSRIIEVRPAGEGWYRIFYLKTLPITELETVCVYVLSGTRPLTRTDTDTFINSCGDEFYFEYVTRGSQLNYLL